MTRDEAKRILAEAGVPDPATDVRRLWDYAMRVGDRPGTHDPSLVHEPNALGLSTFDALVRQRATRKPVSQIIGRRAFWTSEFRVTPDVLDPRPETETLVAAALSEPFARVLDLGTGSGCILISLLMERPETTGVGTDISQKAVLVAGDNAARHKVDDRLILPLSDWYKDIGGRFDLIVSNPPYIASDEMAGLEPEVRDHEPRIALTDEGDGLSAYRAIAQGALDHLTPGGRLLVEIGATQGAAVSALFREAGLRGVAVLCDLDGRDRVVLGRAPTGADL